MPVKSLTKAATILFVLSMITTRSAAQVLPKENSKLNYRIIGFSGEPSHEAGKYTLEIAPGHFNDTGSFSKHIIVSVTKAEPKIIAEVPLFGKEYTWRFLHAGTIPGVLHHFSTGMIQEADTAKSRLRVVTKANSFKDAFVFLDVNKALYDMEGHMVWYLPTSGDRDAFQVRDMKVTTQHTITYVVDSKGVYEMNYNGDTLWKATNAATASCDEKQDLHHEFTRLENGHYMALSENMRYWKKPTATDTSLTYIAKEDLEPGADGKLYSAQPMGTLLEYDRAGNVVWSWRSSDHFNGSNIFYQKNEWGAMQMNAHENSFFFDEHARAIYISCRNLNKIMKIKYPSGKVLRIYSRDGAKKESTTDLYSSFCGQHSCKVSQNGDLYVYNNNTCNPGRPPSIVVARETKANKELLEKVWEYTCPVDTIGKTGFPSGGNVIELPGNLFFVSMAYPDSKVFIVNREKDILWSAIAEKWGRFEKKWQMVNLYRASIIKNRQELEELIWNTEQ